MLSVIAVDIAAPGTFVAQAAAGLAAVGVVARAQRWGTCSRPRATPAPVDPPRRVRLDRDRSAAACGASRRRRGPKLARDTRADPWRGRRLTLGMMSRVALGHTGRPLRATATMRAAFALITVAALARVVAPILWPSAYGASLVAAGRRVDAGVRALPR